MCAAGSRAPSSAFSTRSWLPPWRAVARPARDTSGPGASSGRRSGSSSRTRKASSRPCRRRAHERERHARSERRRGHGNAQPAGAPELAERRHAHAVGGGGGLPLAAVSRFAAAEAQFWIPEGDLGVPLGIASTTRFIRFVGPARAKEIIMGCHRYSAAEAQALGLVTRVVPGAE